MYFQEEVRSYRLIWLTLENSEHASYDQKLFITMFPLKEQAEYKSEFAGTKSTLVYTRNKSASRTTFMTNHFLASYSTNSYISSKKNNRMYQVLLVSRKHMHTQKNNS